VKTIDAQEFRALQRGQWNEAARGWRKWAGLIDDASSEISERLVGLAGIGPGSRVLDVAAGYGEPTLSAARRAGPGGRVVATDMSATMLAFGRERAHAAGLGNIDFVESAASGLAFAPGSFDAALSRFGIIFEPEAERAAERVRGFLTPGSRMAIASWGPPERVPFLAIPMRTAMAQLDVPPPAPGTPGPLSRPTPEALGGLLIDGGFGDVVVEEATVSFAWDSPEAFTTFIREIAPPIQAMIAPHPPQVQEATWAAIAGAVRDVAGDGEVRLDNLVLMASGRA
jgi:SAM-dependent methyltransferase